MQNNTLAVFDRLFKELKFDEVLDAYALVVAYPEEKPSLRLSYTMTTDRGRPIQGESVLPIVVFPIEDTWRNARRLRAKLALLKGT